MKIPHALIKRTPQILQRALLFYKQNALREKNKWLKIREMERKEREELGEEVKVTKVPILHEGEALYRSSLDSQFGYPPQTNTKNRRKRDEILDKRKRRISQQKDVAWRHIRMKFPPKKRINVIQRIDENRGRKESSKDKQKGAMNDETVRNFVKTGGRRRRRKGRKGLLEDQKGCMERKKARLEMKEGGRIKRDGKVSVRAKLRKSRGRKSSRYNVSTRVGDGQGRRDALTDKRIVAAEKGGSRPNKNMSISRRPNTKDDMQRAGDPKVKRTRRFNGIPRAQRGTWRIWCLFYLSRSSQKKRMKRSVSRVRSVTGKIRTYRELEKSRRFRAITAFGSQGPKNSLDNDILRVQRMLENIRAHREDLESKS